MEEYADYIDENGMITIKWWSADDESTSHGEGGGGTDYAYADDADAAAMS
jgi:hypothetical protein